MPKKPKEKEIEVRVRIISDFTLGIFMCMLMNFAFFLIAVLSNWSFVHVMPIIFNLIIFVLYFSANSDEYEYKWVKRTIREYD